jgi:hypothetical protein
MACLAIVDGSGCIFEAVATCTTAASSVTLGTTTVTGGTTGSVLFIGAAAVIQQDNANFFWDDSNNRLGIGTSSPSGKLHVVEASVATGAVPFMVFTSAQNTNQTLSTEINGVRFNMSAGRQWATGAITTQREVRIDGPSYSFVGASTITRASTLYASQPTAGTNATLSNAVPAWFEASTAVTNAATQNMLLLSHITSGTPAAGFGAGIHYMFHDTTNALVDAARLQTDWSIASPVTSRFTILLRSAGAALAAVMTMIPSLTVFTGGIQVGNAAGTDGFRVGSGNQLVMQQVASNQYGITLNGSSVNSGILTWSSSNTNATPAWIIRHAAKSGNSGEAIGVHFDFATNGFTVAAGTPVYATQRMIYAQAPTIVGTTGSTITTVNMLAVDTPIAGSVMTFTNLHVTMYGSSATIGPSGTTTLYSVAQQPAHTITYTNTTGSTAACGVAGYRLGIITVAQNTGSGTLTVTNAATLYIEGAPAAGTGSAVTNTYSIFVDAGIARFDGNGTHVFEIDADTTAPGAATGRIPFKDTSTGGTRYIMVSDT